MPILKVKNDGQWVIVSGGGGGGGSVEVDKTLSKSGTAADAKTTGDRFSALESQIADILYTPINITSFTNNIGVVEIGSGVQSVTFNWSINKTPTTLMLGGTVLRNDLFSWTIGVNAGALLTSDTTYTLKAIDERNAESTRTTKISFLNGVYYGVISDDVIINNDVIRGLTKKLQSIKDITFTETADEYEYIIYALPQSYGTPEFNVGGFDGGFSLHSTFDFTNSSGYTEPYCVWLSDNIGLGETTVKVS